LKAARCFRKGSIVAEGVEQQKKHCRDFQMRHCKAILKGRDNCLQIGIVPSGRAVNKATLLPVLFVFLASAPVFAKKDPPRPFRLPAVVTLNGAQVPAGNYELTLETQGSAVRVTLLKDGEFVATAPGVWVKTGIKYSEDEALCRVNPEGSRSLIELRFAGVAKAIVFDDTNAMVHYSALRH
jgi:hypothetical protein